MAGSKINSGATNIRKTRFRSAAGLLGGASVLAFAGWGMTIGSANAAGKALGVGAKSPLSTVKFTDITGRGYAAQDIATHKASVFLFVSCQCPISNVYTPRFQALSDDYTKRGIQVFAVYSDWHESKADVVKHVRDHKITFPAIKDERNSLADRLGATSTPQAVVVGSDAPELAHGNTLPVEIVARSLGRVGTLHVSPPSLRSNGSWLERVDDGSGGSRDDDAPDGGFCPGYGSRAHGVERRSSSCSSHCSRSASYNTPARGSRDAQTPSTRRGWASTYFLRALRVRSRDDAT